MKKRLLTIVPFLLGLFLCGYPLISSLVERQHQQNAVATYKGMINKESLETLKESTERAKRYNNLLWQVNDAIVGDIGNRELSDESYQKLLNLSENGIMGTLQIPKINVNLPIYHGTDEEVLKNGIGHMQGSSLPVGGANTHCVLTGHRGLPNSKLFTRLDELENGDLFFIDVCGTQMAYQIKNLQIIKPEEVDCLNIEAEKDLVSLVTCTPYGINTHRLVVTGERISYQKGEEKKIKGKMMSVRELLFAAMPVVFICYAIVNLLRYGRGKKEREKKQRRKGSYRKKKKRTG